MITRRQALVRLGALLGAGSLSPALLNAQDTTVTATRTAARKSAAGAPLIIAHITDTHITNEYHSDKWVSEVFQQIQSHPAKPSLVLHTGDIIMDSVHTPRPRVDEYWKIWKATAKRECSLPIHYAIGNHDVWGTRYPINDPASKDPNWGKGLAREQLELEKTYSSVDAGAWQVIMLDSISPFTDGGDGKYNWIAKLDQEQLTWLDKQLAALPADKPVLIGSHIPIIQMTSMANLKPEEDGSYSLGPKNMHADARELIDLFNRHRDRVKLCLSGHTHYNSLVDLNGVSYFNAGSVCGVQWQHMDQRPDRPGYTIVKLYPDGRFEYDYENYGWKPTGEVKAA